MNVSFEVQVSWRICSLLYRDVYPEMSNMFEKKCLVFGWIFFNSFHWGSSRSSCFSSDELQRGTWERRLPLWQGCQDSGCVVSSGLGFLSGFITTIWVASSKLCPGRAETSTVGPEGHKSQWIWNVVGERWQFSSLMWFGSCCVVQDMKHRCLVMTWLLTHW